MKAGLESSLIAISFGIIAVSYFWYSWFTYSYPEIPPMHLLLGGMVLIVGGIMMYPYNHINYKLKACTHCGIMTMLKDDDDKPECIVCYKGITLRKESN